MMIEGKRHCAVGAMRNATNKRLSFQDRKLPNNCYYPSLVSSHTEFHYLESSNSFFSQKCEYCHFRTGIAYVSNVAVRERHRHRRNGIAKRLVAKAEAQARSWGFKCIKGLHFDLNDPAATKLYKGQGFKCVKVPEGAKWPHPKTAPDVQFKFMMKLLNTPPTT